MTEQKGQSKKRKQGAPKGNTNALRHGLRASTLPSEYEYLNKECRKYRQLIEDEVIKVKGEVSLTDAHLISSAVEMERTARVFGNWFRKKTEELSIADKIKLLESITKLKEKRDGCIMKLKLDSVPPSTGFDLLDDAGSLLISQIKEQKYGKKPKDGENS